MLDTILEKFREEPLSSTYYLGGILIALGSAVLWILSVFGAYVYAAPYILPVILLLVGLAIVFVPLLVSRIAAPQKHEVLNPKVKISKSVCELSVWENRRLWKREDTLVAKGMVQRYAFLMRPTGTGTVAVKLLSQGKLFGPLEKRERIRYEVEFPEPLHRGGTYVLRLEIMIDDPNRDMKPYFGVLGAGVAEFGSLNAILYFPERKPRSVSYEVSAYTTGKSRGQIEEVIMDDQGGYPVKIDKVGRKEMHTISWAW